MDLEISDVGRCGRDTPTCAPTTNASAPPLEGHAEPFTQSAYYSVAGGECGAGYANATNTTVGGSPRMLRWACGGGGSRARTARGRGRRVRERA